MNKKDYKLYDFNELIILFKFIITQPRTGQNVLKKTALETSFNKS